MINKLGMKLDFVCIGAQKAGTTKLHEIFKNHDSVFLPDEKEANFFEIDERYKNGIDYFFETFYNNYDGKEALVGLFDPNLQLDLVYVQRILDNFKNVKIIFVLRNPVLRAFSHFNMSKLRGFETNNFMTALELEENRLNNPKNNHKGYKTKVLGHFEKNHFGYIQRGLYFELLKFLKENVKQENYKVVLFEDFVANMDETVRELCDFLEVPSFEQKIDAKKSNQAKEERIKGINAFLKNSYLIKKSKFIVSSKFKVKVKKVIRKMNSKEDLKVNDLDNETKKKVYDMHFSEEIEKIEKDFNLDLLHWKY